MNLHRYPAGNSGIPDGEEILSLVRESNSFEVGEFNTEVQRVMGRWHNAVEEYRSKSKGTISEQVLLKMHQTGDDEISSRVIIETGSLAVLKQESAQSRVPITTFTDLGLTAFNGEIGLVFITGGDLSDDINEAIYVPTIHANKIRVSSHVLVSNNP